jgi:16S rRNA (guanine966-N2)-methyltransferase
MRIIAGTAGGRRLQAPDSTGTRPATDRVREAVFSSIGRWVEEAAVADLYAGSGSFGLEALSRGASKAVFVESGRRALEALRHNIGTVGLGGSVVASTTREYLKTADDVFHLVFIDPPWSMQTEEVEDDFVLLDRLLAPNAVVVTSRRHGDRAPDIPDTWSVVADKRYGDTRILRYEKTGRSGA